MRLFVIGNGFDMGHGLKTKYPDFRNYLSRCYPEFLASFEENYMIVKQDLWWNELEANLANINDDVMVEQADSVEFGLEGGDIGIEDTLYSEFGHRYEYIENFSKYMKQWIRSVRIRDLKKVTSLIVPSAGDKYVTFNYTGVLERVYSIPSSDILHIHGSLRIKDGDPVIGHGDSEKINELSEKLKLFEESFDEKKVAGCRVARDYLMTTFKDTNRMSWKLVNFVPEGTEHILVIGHSIAGVDQTYFSEIDRLTGKAANWQVYYYGESKKDELSENILKCGIDENRVKLVVSDEFYDL